MFVIIAENMGASCSELMNIIRKQNPSVSPSLDVVEKLRMCFKKRVDRNRKKKGIALMVLASEGEDSVDIFQYSEKPDPPFVDLEGHKTDISTESPKVGSRKALKDLSYKQQLSWCHKCKKNGP